MSGVPTHAPNPSQLNSLENQSGSRRGLVRSAGVMGIATLISRFFGLVREQVFAYLFGAGNATDAFNVAFRIPNLFRDLFAEGAMSASLVPTFTQTREIEGQARAWRVAGLVFRVLFLFVSGLALLGAFWAPELVLLYASHFKEVPGKFELTVLMTRVLFAFFPFVALAAAFMGVLNASGVFFLPALASALFNVTSVVVGVITVVLIQKFNLPIEPIVGMAIGVVAGGGVQAFCQLPKLIQKGYRWQPRTASDPSWSSDPRLRQMLWMMVPGTIGLAATQINILVNTILATSQQAGSVSWLNYAFRLMQFPIGVFGVSLASATLARLSVDWAKGDHNGASETLSSSLKSVFAVNLPASAGLGFLSVPIISLIFEYGRFSQADTHATAMALMMYAIGLTAYSSVKVLVPACYALGHTKIAVISSVLTVGLTLSLNLIMVKSLGYWGLALGTSIGAVFNALFLLVSIRSIFAKKGVTFSLLGLAPRLIQYLALAALMGILCEWSERGLSGVFPDVYFNQVLGGFGTVLCRMLRVSLVMSEAVAFVVAAAWVFKLTEILEVLEIFAKKLKIKLRVDQS